MPIGPPRTKHYYNEFDPYAAAWLRNLIDAGLIPYGDVDTRSIVEVQPEDLEGYAQCHFFAGIGGWALAALLAGWPEDRELWTGSAPCQPFSLAGQGKAQADDRHLWPHLFRLARARRPAVLMGEQVAAAVGKDWLDGVSADLEGIGYSCGAAVVPACAVDAPHRRDRLWFVAYANDEGSQGLTGDELRASEGWGESVGPAAPSGVLDRPSRGHVAHPDCIAGGQSHTHAGGCSQGSGAWQVPGLECPGDGDVADARGELRQQISRGAHGDEGPDEGRTEEVHYLTPSDGESQWANSAWVTGHDGKARRVQPSIPLLAHGVSARVGRLRAYGNAIVPQVAAEVIAAYMDVAP